MYDAEEIVAQKTSLKAIAFCLGQPDFKRAHIKHSGVGTARVLPSPSIEWITDIFTNILKKATLLSGIIHAITMDTGTLSPTLIFYPHTAGAPNAHVKAKTKRMLELWYDGNLGTLAAQAVAASVEKKLTGGTRDLAISSRRARALIKKKSSRAAELADSYGLAPAIMYNDKVGMFLHHAARRVLHVDMILLYVRRAATVTRETLKIMVSVDTLRECLVFPPPISPSHRNC